MAYRGENQVDSTVQVWDGSSWVQFGEMTLTASGNAFALTCTTPGAGFTVDGKGGSAGSAISVAPSTGDNAGAFVIDVEALNAGAAGQIQIQSRAVSGSTGGIRIQSSSTSGAVGDLELLATSSTAASGDVTLETSAGGGNSGLITLRTNSGGASTGGILLQSSTGGAGAAGDITMRMTSPAGNSGNVVIDANSGVLEAGRTYKTTSFVSQSDLTEFFTYGTQ
jgi:hypothetical protein